MSEIVSEILLSLKLLKLGNNFSIVIPLSSCCFLWFYSIKSLLAAGGKPTYSLKDLFNVRRLQRCTIVRGDNKTTWVSLKGHCHDDFAVLGQLCVEIITLNLYS